MQTSLHRRALPKLIIVALVALVMGMFYAGADVTDAQPRPGTPCPGCPSAYTANTYQTVSSSTTSANANLTLDLQIYNDSLNFYAVNFFTPPQATVKAGPDHPSADANAVLGDVVGILNADVNISALGQQCDNGLSIPFQLMNATTNNAGSNEVFPSALTDTGGFLGTLDPFARDNPGIGGAGGLGAGSAAGINNDLPTVVDRYPAFVNELFNDIQPWARYVGINIVSNFVTLNFVVFGPGALAAAPAPNPSSDMGLASLGYSSVTVLNDPTAPAAPGVTDFCSDLATVATMYGITKDNPCTDLPAAEANNDTCAGVNDAQLWGFTAGADTARVRYANPSSAGTYLYPSFHLSARDLDLDGYENGFDTCPTTATTGFNGRISGAGGFGGTNDSDADMIPGGGPGGGCDTNLSSSDLNEDGDDDNGAPTKLWLNSQDNCPRVANDSQLESELATAGGVDTIARPRGGPESDSMGDACDGAESVCTGAVDEDLDGLINDGCPTVGSLAEKGCLNAVDDKDENPATNAADDDDTTHVNDGCPSSNDVANGSYYATFTLSPICIGGTDGDNDGWCNSSSPRSFTYGAGSVSLSDPNDANVNVSPEHYALTFPFPVAESGARSSSSPAPARQPTQLCNDGIDNNGAGGTDIADTNCKPPIEILITKPNAGYYPDADDDGFSNELEIYLGTDPMGRCENGGTVAVPSTDWPADIEGSDDTINVADLTGFLTPTYRLFNGPAGVNWSQRYDLAPDADINIGDLTVIINLKPPMRPFQSTGALLSSPCTPANQDLGSPAIND